MQKQIREGGGGARRMRRAMGRAAGKHEQSGSKRLRVSGVETRRWRDIRVGSHWRCSRPLAFLPSCLGCVYHVAEALRADTDLCEVS